MYNEYDGLAALLPEAYRKNDKESNENFLAGFLKTIEWLMLRNAPSKEEIAIRRKVEKIYQLFYPLSDLWNGTKENSLNAFFDADRQELLNWLGGWFAYVPQYAIGEYINRKTIAELIRLYRIRGTVKGLEKAINLFLTDDAQVEISDPEYPVKNSSIAPHTFQLLIKWRIFDLTRMQEQKQMVEEIVQKEKPAHVTYAIEFTTPSLRVEYQSRVGIDTFIGSDPNA